MLEDVLERLGGLPARRLGAQHIVNDRKEPGRLIELRASILEIAVGVLNLQRNLRGLPSPLVDPP